MPVRVVREGDLCPCSYAEIAVREVRRAGQPRPGLHRPLASSSAKISVATLLAAGIALDSRSRPQQRRRLDDLLAAGKVEVLPFDEAQARLARHAYTDVGKGSGHAAQLNLGDTFAYALHRSTDEPMLFQG